jgi:hypothetical protein
MQVIVITFEDTRLEGVEAVVVIPPGLTGNLPEMAGDR